MNYIDNITLRAAYSIDLYAINLKKVTVPEKSIQYQIRRFTPQRLAFNAFGCYLTEEPTKIVSSHLMKQSPISDLAAGYPTVVM
jgi:hypothetical protein